jgi:SAM-dependent methyltransferase
MSPFVDFGMLPKTGIFLASPADTYPEARLAYRFCNRCACVLRERDLQVEYDYDEVARSTSRQFPAYARSIILSLFEQAQDNLLIEIGSNDGTFMNHLRAAGVNRMFGVEPSRPLAQAARAKGHLIENVPLTLEEAHRLRVQFGGAAAIVCRHTLEHVPDPLSFLKAIRHLLDETGLLYIEVPSVAPIIDLRLQGYELWDEHLTYFSEINLAVILASAGFVIEGIQSLPHCSSDNILCWAKPAGESMSWNSEVNAVADLRACTSFASRWGRYRELLLAQSLAWPEPIYAMGASHPQSNFLHFSGLMQRIVGLVDDDPNKVGKFAPADGRPVKIITTEDLAAHTTGTLLLTGFGYPDWMDQVSSMLADRKLHIVRPFKQGVFNDKVNL